MKNRKRLKKNEPNFDFWQARVERAAACSEFIQILSAKLGESCSLAQYKLAVKEFIAYRHGLEIIQLRSHYSRDLVEIGYDAVQFQRILDKKIRGEERHLTYLDEVFLSKMVEIFLDPDTK